MAETINIKKGYDIPLTGAATGNPIKCASKEYAICPSDFPGYAWRLEVSVGDNVTVGSPLLSDKSGKGIKLVSPVNGVVKEVRRGERRKILYVVLECTNADDKPLANLSDNLIDNLKDSGLWAFMRQRPFDIIPDPEVVPRDIFVTSFDSAPLAPELILPEKKQFLEEGLKALASLTSGDIYLFTRFGTGISSSIAKVYEVKGPHPAGNVGVQIANVKPVNKGETVWTLDISLVCRIGEFLSKRNLDFSTRVAITGPAAANPCFVDTIAGCSLKAILEASENSIKDSDKVFVISGNVLTGIRENADEDFLRFPYRQITMIESGADSAEVLGWASLSPSKLSLKRSFPSFWHIGKKRNFDSRLNGGHRAVILTGEYDKLIPMDIFAEYLLKAIEARDIDKMEGLGIYEVAPEDFALPEFADTSKRELQRIVRDGLDYLRSQIS